MNIVIFGKWFRQNPQAMFTDWQEGVLDGRFLPIYGP